MKLKLRIFLIKRKEGEESISKKVWVEKYETEIKLSRELRRKIRT